MIILFLPFRSQAFEDKDLVQIRITTDCSAQCPRKSKKLNKSLLVDKCMIKGIYVLLKSIILLKSL